MGKAHCLTLAIAAAATLLAACTERDMERPEAGDHLITFVPAMSDGVPSVSATRSAAVCPLVSESADTSVFLYAHVSTRPWTEAVTRGTQVNTLSQLTSFGVSGFKLAPADNINTLTTNFIYNAQVTNSGSATNWRSTDAYYWPNTNETLNFYAYAPYDNGTSTNYVQLKPATTLGPTAIDYTVAPSPAQQVDLLTAQATGETFNNNILYAVSLPFSHALTALNIELGENVIPGYIEKISFNNICTTGTYTFGKGWTLGAKTDYTVDFTSGGATSGHSTATSSFEAEGMPIFMIPQTFPVNDPLYLPSISLTAYDELNGRSVVTIPIQPAQWEAGTVVNYLITTSSINYVRLEQVTYPALWGTESFALKNSYATNEQIGVFAVDKNTGEVIDANVPYHKDSNGRWVPASEERSQFSPDRIYYAYYPYKLTLTGAPVKGATVTVNADADTFFGTVISNWTVSPDQSTAAKLLANDLHISRGTAGTGASTMQFSMKHALALATLTLEQATLPNDLYFLTTDVNYTWTDNGTTTITASSSFSSTATPCSSGTANTYYYVMTPGTTETFSANATTADNEWSGNVTTATATISGNLTCTASLRRASTHFTQGAINRHSYTLAVGDCYYTDGALGKSSTTYGNRKTAIGTVFCTTPSTSDVQAGYTHGYVMASRNSRVGNVEWSTTTTNVGNGYVGANATAIRADMDGRKKTERIATISGYETKFPPVNAVINVLPTYFPVPAKPRSSGWFLPSAGQFVEWLKVIADEVIGSSKYTIGDGQYGLEFTLKNGTTNAQTFAAATNTYYANRGFNANNDNHRQIVWSSEAHVNFWTSSEYNVTYPYNLRFGKGQAMKITNQDARSVLILVRGALAF